jgi:hypothetical protein
MVWGDIDLGRGDLNSLTVFDFQKINQIIGSGLRGVILIVFDG